jgi:CBS domain containing-hemolysin-like protein
VFLGSIQAAFSALMRLSLRLMAERGGRDDRLGRYLDDPLHLFIPVRILIGVCTVLAGVLIARLSDVRDALSIVTFIVSLVAFVVVCEHLVPLLIVRRDPEKVLDFLLPAFHAIATVLLPITAVIINLVAPRRERETTNGGNGSDDAAPERASESEPEEGTISDAEGRELLQSIVDFTETVVREVMTPRPDIIAIRADASLQDLRSLFREEQYSRMPVYRDNLDNIIGIVFVKDLVALPPNAEPPMTTLMRSAHFVPESKRVSELLKEMQARQRHMSIVIDEYGGTAGLATLEDLIEELVGEIVDEFDVEDPQLEPLPNGDWRVNARMPLDEVNELLRLDLPEGDWDTIGGLVFNALGHVPTEGEAVEIDGHRLRAERVDGRRIGRVRITRARRQDA